MLASFDFALFLLHLAHDDGGRGHCRDERERADPAKAAPTVRPMPLSGATWP